MIVSFLHVGPDPTLAEIMVASVKRHMPTVPIIHMRDEATPQIAGCSSQVIPWDGRHLMTYRLQHLAAMPKREMATLDTDVVVQKDLRPVFWRPFQVALTKRKGPIYDPNGVDLAQEMPYNAGVVFTRSAAFWTDCYAWCRESPEALQTWYGDQHALKRFAKDYEALELDCGHWNYTPATADEDVSHKAIVHFKGRRKQWMIDRYGAQ
jgi:hypothetical protein